MHRCIIQHVANNAYNAANSLIQIYVHKLPPIHTYLHLNTNTIAKWPLLCVLRSVAYHIHLNLLLKVHFTSSMLASPTRRMPHIFAANRVDCVTADVRSVFFFFVFSFILRQLDCIRTAKDKRQTTTCWFSTICIAVLQQIMRFPLMKRRTQDNRVLLVLRLFVPVFTVNAMWLLLLLLLIMPSPSHLIGKFISDAKC